MSTETLLGYISAERSMLIDGVDITTEMPEAKRMTVRCRPNGSPMTSIPRTYVMPLRPSVGAVTVHATKAVKS